ncbi:MAG: hypothetical protein S4CHLAM45_07590 [Chlamydiales bacterium]|nr:hypothetical protein [Chlamydiales bacterium]MCH9620031.1 hypothetical protein [Chlamydiales bacterium]MCH9622866.1 hypothetical protein [Chlamydiales bacterium]
MSPYTGANLFTFFWVFFKRFITGTMTPLATDELQLFVLIGIALSCSLIGTFLMLRKMTMLANALSHTILLGIVITYLFFSATMGMTSMLIASFITAIATTFLTQFLTKWTHLQEDASIGLIFTLLFALGLFLITLYTRNLHIGTELIMGNVDALQQGDLFLVWSTLLLNTTLFFLFFRGFLLTTFDPTLARSFGFSSTLFYYLLMVQTALTTITAFRSIGIFMVLAFLIVPPMTAHLFSKTLKGLLFTSCTISVLAVFIGVALSRHFYTLLGIGLSTGGVVVTLLFIQFFGVAIVRKPMVKLFT